MLLIRKIAAALILLSAVGARADDLGAVLEKTGREAAAYLDRVSDVRCTEQVTQLKLGDRDRVEYSEQSSYDYFVLLQGGDDDLLLNESRLATGRAAKPAKNVPMLVSNGFATLFLIFHPFYRGSFEFTYDGEDDRSGQRLVRIRFVHRKGMRTPAALAVRGREYPLDLAGTAWIDPASGMIARIEATLQNNMTDVGLRTLRADVEYAPTRLPGWTRDYRFPVTATVDVETLRQHWRNVHRFSNYSRFVVDTHENVSTGRSEKK